MTRLTDIETVVTTAPGNALIHFVDVDDDTETPDGTSKVIERDDFLKEPNGLLVSTLAIAVLTPVTANILIDIDPPTAISPFTTSDFVADVDGSMKYVGPGLKAKIIFMVALERASGTTGLELILLRNAVQFASISGPPEITVDSAPKYIYAEIDLVTNDILNAQTANSSSGSIIIREFYMRVEKR